MRPLYFKYFQTKLLFQDQNDIKKNISDKYLGSYFFAAKFLVMQKDGFKKSDGTPEVWYLKFLKSVLNYKYSWQNILVDNYIRIILFKHRTIFFSYKIIQDQSRIITYHIHYRISFVYFSCYI